MAGRHSTLVRPPSRPRPVVTAELSSENRRPRDVPLLGTLRVDRQPERRCRRRPT